MMTIETLTPKNGLGKKKTGEIYRLQKFMASARLKPVDIANKTGISERTITHSLYEEKPLGAKLLRTLHAEFGLSIDWIISGVGHMYIAKNQVKESQADYPLTAPVNHERARRIISFVNDYASYASNDDMIWLETDLKFKLVQYRQFLNEQDNDQPPTPN